MQYCVILFWLNQLCVRWVVQRNKRGLAQALLFSDNQAAVLQLSEDPRGALAVAVEFGLRLFQGCLLYTSAFGDHAARLGACAHAEI